MAKSSLPATIGQSLPLAPSLHDDPVGVFASCHSPLSIFVTQGWMAAQAGISAGDGPAAALRGCGGGDQLAEDRDQDCQDWEDCQDREVVPFHPLPGDQHPDQDTTAE